MSHNQQSMSVTLGFIAMSLIAMSGLAMSGACTQDTGDTGDTGDKAANANDTGSDTNGVAAAHPGHALMNEQAPAATPTGEKLDLPGKTYGNGVTQADTVSISELMADPKAYEGKAVRVEGTVTDVCPKRGCWFEMAGDTPGEKMRFKVRDGDMVFPMDAKGQYAVAEGVVFTRQLTMEQTKEYLEYQASEYGTEVDLESVAEPMTIVRLNGQGAVLRESR